MKLKVRDAGMMDNLMTYNSISDERGGGMLFSNTRLSRPCRIRFLTDWRQY
jgi:hypothetical protein